MTWPRYLFLIGLGWMCFLTALSLSAGVMTWLWAPDTKLAVVGMLGQEHSPRGLRLYAILYTAVLLGTATCAWIFTWKPWGLLRILTGLGATGVLAMTLYPVIRNWMFDFRPSFYEYYVGEAITCLAAVLLIVGAMTPRLHIGPSRPTDS